jgi:hypothetical protein
MNTHTLQRLFFFSLGVLLIFFHVCPTDADWTIVTVDRGDVGWYTSLALDGSGNPRISYHESTNEDLQYAWCDMACDDTTNWDSIIVDSSGDVGRHSSLYDSSGTSHISYYDETTVDDGDLKYATCNSGCDTPGNWTTETVDSTDDVGLDTSLALDGGGNPHISYFDATSLNLKYAFKSGGSWNIVTVDSLGTVGQYTSLALDGSGNPRISYHGNSTLKYAWCDTVCDDSGNWTAITVDSSASDVGEFTSLALNSSGNPRISYASFPSPTNGDLKYASCDAGCDIPGNWTTETVDSTGNTGWDTSLALDSIENPHIAYYRFDLGNLRYAKHNGNNWELEDVDTIGDVGEFCSLALDSNDDPHISYYDFDLEDLKYALLAEPCLVDGDCNDNNVCTDDTCNVGTGNCIFTPNSNACDDGLFCTLSDQCSGGACVGSGDPCDVSQVCDEETDMCYDDFDGDGVFDNEDNCIDTPNPGQEDTSPPQGNGIGDACDCEGDFNCDGNVDAVDVDAFLADFGRSTFFNPCTNNDPCQGDFDCNVNVDAADVDKFLEDFGRSQFFDPCPACIPGNWCVYP